MTKEVSGKVTEVENRGLHIVLEDNTQAFLPKENMHIGKKKKLEEIFSRGYGIKAKVKSRKDGRTILTQKEEKITESNTKKQKTESKLDKKKVKSKKKETKSKQEKAQEQPKKQTQEKIQNEEQERPKQKTLTDLKKLSSIGNMKISVGRGNKANITELSEQKEEVVKLPKVPEGLLEEIITTTKIANEKYDKITVDLRERGLLNGN